jgi:hypothetical protein
LIPRLTTVEDHLASAVAPIGPVMAIGRPGEPLPLPGAMRTYASDDEWQEVVDKWLSMARLVILWAGDTEGLWWETQRVVATVSPHKVLFFSFGMDQSRYESLAGRMSTAFGIQLPSFNEVQKWRSVSGFFEFENDWTPRFLALRAPYLRSRLFSPMQAFFHYTLRPVFDKLGVGWRPLPVAVMKSGLVIFEGCMLSMMLASLLFLMLILLLLLLLYTGVIPGGAG